MAGSVLEGILNKRVKTFISSSSDRRLRLAFSFSIATMFCYLLAAGLKSRMNTTILQNDSLLMVRRREDVEQKSNSEEFKSRDQLYIEYFNMTEASKTNGTKRKKRLPDIIGIGVEKCGTGALRWMLVQHPMIIGSEPKELHFFNNPEKFKKGPEYYESLMPEVADYELTFEKTPAYFVARKDLPKDMKNSVPNAKVIVVLCDPVNRTFSDFVQEELMGNIREMFGFEVTIYQLLGKLNGIYAFEDDDDAVMNYIQNMYESHANTHIITAGMYYYHIRRWLKEYTDGEIHIVDGSELIHDPGSAMEKVQEFLGIPKLLTKDDFVLGSSGFYCFLPSTVNQTPYGLQVFRESERICMKSHVKGRTRNGRWKHKPSDLSIRLLTEFYEPYNRKLFQLLGKEFNWQQPKK